MDERLDNAPTGYLSLSASGRILWINKTLLTLLDYREEEVQGHRVNVILSKSSQIFYQLYFIPMIKLEGKVEAMHLTLKLKNGHDFPVLLNAVRTTREGLIVNECILFPIQERYEFEQAIIAAKEEAEESERSKDKVIAELEEVSRELEIRQKELLSVNNALRKLTVTDELTGIDNRRSYKKALSENFSLYKSEGTPFSLLIIDIDRFKEANDRYGHFIGDEILQDLATILKEATRNSDIITRYGGDEFIIVLPDTAEADSINIAERIHRRVETASWPIPSVTVSIGITTTIFKDAKKNIQSRADEALYKSKNNGRNQITHSLFYKD